MSGHSGIAAVVLNYKTWEDAVVCVNDLLAQNCPDKHIVIVDNGSGNGSFEQLKAAFSNESSVTVLNSQTNLGFARGNNLGIRYAHEKLGYDTVFVVNSDTRIDSSLFAAVSSMDLNGVGAVSPTVLRPDGSPQRPAVNCDNISSHARKTVWNLIKANFVSLPGVSRLYDAYSSKKHQPQKSCVRKVRRCILQGCSYFLTPDFFAHYRGIYPATFLYWEEVDLLLMLKKAGLESIAPDTPPVTHFGEGSTQVVTLKKSRFRLKHSNRSMVKSLPLICGMSESRIKKLIDASPEFASEL